MDMETLRNWRFWIVLPVALPLWAIANAGGVAADALNRISSFIWPDEL